MNERLAFGYGTTGHEGEAPARTAGGPADEAMTESTSSIVAPHIGRRERTDWAFTGLLAFTAILFRRPQEQIPA